MRIHVAHRTAYHYAESATYSIQILKLTPRREPGQRTVAWQLDTPGRCIEQIDAFGNRVHLLTIEGAHNEVVVAARGEVETDGNGDGYLPPDEMLAPSVYLSPTPLTAASPEIVALAREIFGDSGANERTLMQLMEAVTTRVHYRSGSSRVTDSAAEVLRRGSGVCQDQAHLAIALCRAAGIPARYVSGHIFTGDSHAASHAWIDAWLSADNCWLSLDVTHVQAAGTRLFRLAVGRDYLDAAPVRGVRRGGGQEQMQVQVLVQDSPLLQPTASHANMVQQAIQQ